MSNYHTDILIQNITKLMKQNNTTQLNLAEYLFMSQSNVSKALSLTDKKNFTLEQVIGIANYFNVSIDLLVGNTKSSKLNTSQRAIASFFVELISNKNAKFTEIEVEEDIYENDYDTYNISPECTHKRELQNYLALYLPSYWNPQDAENDIQVRENYAEVTQIGNDTSMLPVNNFLVHFNEINTLYNNKQLPEEIYNIVIEGLLNNLKED